MVVFNLLVVVLRNQGIGSGGGLDLRDEEPRVRDGNICVFGMDGWGNEISEGNNVSKRGRKNLKQ